MLLKFMRYIVPAVLLAGGVASGQVSVSTFGGGDPGEGLDLQGTFLPGYAVYAGSANETATYQIQDAIFENSLVAGGIDITAPLETPFGNPAYGATTNDTNLTNITNYVRYGGHGSPAGSLALTIDAPTVIGQEYKLQLLFNEAGPGGVRGFDIFAEGALIQDDFSAQLVQGDVDGNNAPGALLTYIFTAADTILDIDFRVDEDGTFGDNNAIIDAVSLEVIPEPASIGLVAAAAILALRRRHG